MIRIALPLAVVVLFFSILVVPTVRLLFKHGRSPFVFQREADPFQKVIGVSLMSTMAAILLWSILYWRLGPQALGVWSPSPWFAVCGWLCITGGGVIVALAQAQMGASLRIGIDDRTTSLVTSGLFRIVRNPIFSGMLLAVVGLALVTPSAWTVMIAIMSIQTIAIQTRLEEKHLIDCHGESYLTWAARVGRFLPAIGRLQPARSVAEPR